MAELQITVKLPGPDDPGFLRRQRDLLGALGRMDEARSGHDVPAMMAAMDQVADEVAQYLEAPEGADPRELAYELSRNQFYEVLGALAGKAEPPPRPR